MPRIARLGHVGLHCVDLEKQKDFYHRVLGLQITDEDPETGMVFMSARPEEEHHELLLLRGRNVAPDGLLLQQIAFRCDSLEDVLDFRKRLEAANTTFDIEVTHGNAVGLYFFDPEGNRAEVYWDTGMKARQPYVHLLDLSRPADEVLAAVRASVSQYAETGFMDPALVPVRK